MCKDLHSFLLEIAVSKCSKSVLRIYQTSQIPQHGVNIYFGAGSAESGTGQGVGRVVLNTASQLELNPRGWAKQTASNRNQTDPLRQIASHALVIFSVGVKFGLVLW